MVEYQERDTWMLGGCRGGPLGTTFGWGDDWVRTYERQDECEVGSEKRDEGGLRRLTDKEEQRTEGGEEEKKADARMKRKQLEGAYLIEKLRDDMKEWGMEESRWLELKRTEAEEMIRMVEEDQMKRGDERRKREEERRQEQLRQKEEEEARSKGWEELRIAGCASPAGLAVKDERQKTRDDEEMRQAG